MTRRTLVAGEALVDFIPETAGPLASVRAFERRAGGAPANVAVALARLGAAPWFCTALSTDPFGTFLAERLAAEGLPDRFVVRVDRPTTLAFVSHAGGSEPSFTFYRNGTADVHLDTGVVDDATLSTVDRVVVGGVTLTAEPGRSATFDLVERARAAGCRIVFDPNTRPELWGDADPTPTVARMCRLTDVLRATAADLAPTALPGGPFPGGLLDAGPDTVLVTRGADGATAVAGPDSPWGAGEWHHPGYDADVRDATGAGDAFLAGALVALAEGSGPAETLSFANAVGAATTTAAGAMAALPDRAAAERIRSGSDSGPGSGSGSGS